MPSFIPSRLRLAGFSLIEVLLASAIIASVFIALIGLIGVGLDRSREVQAKEEALRLMGAVEARLEAEDFDTVYQWVQDEESLVAYSYRADLQSLRPDGSPAPSNSADDPLFTMARLPTDALVAADIVDTENGLYRFALQLSETNPEPDLASLPALPEDYLEAVIVIEFEVSALPDVALIAEPLTELFVYPLAKRR